MDLRPQPANYRHLTKRLLSFYFKEQQTGEREREIEMMNMEPS